MRRMLYMTPSASEVDVKPVLRSISTLRLSCLEADSGFDLPFAPGKLLG
jgi:hypothetical protein